MKKDGRIAEGFYIHSEPNKWSPILYFRKPKGADQEKFEQVRKALIFKIKLLSEMK